jgi:hypothetical protein
MKTFEECCEEVAQKHGLGKRLVTGHRASLFKEAADLWATQLVVGAVDLAREHSASSSETVLGLETHVEWDHSRLSIVDQLISAKS